MEDLHATTILAVARDGQVAMAGDGQVTLGERIAVKNNATKVRRLYDEKVLCGFAGSAADAFTLEERFEARLRQYNNLTRAAVELAREWRMDKVLRQLDALLLVADKQRILLISGRGDVIEPDHNAVAIGSGGSFAFAAARAFLDSGCSLSAAEIAKRSLLIAAEICVYTNKNIVVEVLK